MENPDTDAVQPRQANALAPAQGKTAWHSSPRAKIFALTFATVAITGLVYSFAQPTIYTSQATLLRSTAGADRLPNPAQAAEISIGTLYPVLFSSELLAKTQAQLAAAGYSVIGVAEIKSRLRAQAVADSGLLEISAEGPDAQLLPLLINTWLDVYLEAMTASLEKQPLQTEQPKSEELEKLTTGLNKARSDLETFRQTHGGQPGALDSRAAQVNLQALNRALKSATRQEKQAQSALTQAQENLARGESVLTRAQQRQVQSLERKLDGLETKLADLDARYTRQFLQLQPKLRVLPEQIEELKLEIDRLKVEGTEQAMNQLQRAHAESRQAVTGLEQQIADQDSLGKDATALGSELETHTNNVKNLENMLREARARLMQPGSSPDQPYPQFTVIQRAFVPDSPIGADRQRNALISLAAGLVAALFAWWLYGFLNPVHAAPPSGPGAKPS